MFIVAVSCDRLVFEMQPSLSAEIEAAANEAVSSLGPTKSSEKYCAAYDHFKKWCDSKNVNKFEENVFFSKEQFETFLFEAQDDLYLGLKVIRFR